MAKRRELSIFSLSFLDIMACGFGAVILIFILIDHSSEVESQQVSAELRAEVKLLEEQVEDSSEDLVEVRNTLEDTNDEIVTAETMRNSSSKRFARSNKTSRPSSRTARAAMRNSTSSNRN
ncbi:MAG: hypothetical protein U5O39_07755 [Gammaproteobacteria bacterium]|nr:hypothetical protein [Gammaproteobacteria bacterium]